ncbi:MAG: hypothetical protein JNK64_05950 [Myxococcales bacterium]|nr:hypothetical protein [Myxococcales bacterium]
MGVEYKHGLFVADLAWRPTAAHVARVHDVLTRWRLVAGPPALRDLGEDGGPIDAAALAAELPANLRLTYDGAAGAPVVALMGPSQYGYTDPAMRYLQGVAVTLGVDLRLLSCETYPVEVEVPAIDGDAFLELDEYADDEGHPLYRATWATSPPSTRVRGRFAGVWRSAVIIDCGKDLPTLAEGCDAPLPAAGFRDDLEAALGTALIEQGWID